MIDSIIDTYHGNAINVEAVKEAGIVAIIHKATQGSSFKDSKYRQRRDQAKDLGLLWGAYHFSTGESVSSQVENFLAHAVPAEDDLIALDWEPSNGPDMTIEQARHFVQMVREETGRWPLIYGGHHLRKWVGHKPDPVLSHCPLWYARYATHPIGIPIQIWPTYTLWQYTDGVAGPEPRETPGTSGADRNRFAGTEEELRQAWPFARRTDDESLGPGFTSILAAQANS